MHYKNGREAKTGDLVIGRNYTGNVFIGGIFDLNAGAETCNCRVAEQRPGGSDVRHETVGNLVHAEDALACLEATIAPPAAAPEPAPTEAAPEPTAS